MDTYRRSWNIERFGITVFEGNIRVTARGVEDCIARIIDALFNYLKKIIRILIVGATDNYNESGERDFSQSTHVSYFGLVPFHGIARKTWFAITSGRDGGERRGMKNTFEMR